MKKEATEAGQKCWLGPCRRHLYFQAPLPALDGIISPRCLGSHPVRRTKANPGAVSGEAAIRPLIAKAVQLMSKPPETTHFSHEWRRVATWGFANGAQTTRADSLTIVKNYLQFVPVCRSLFQFVLFTPSLKNGRNSMGSNLGHGFLGHPRRFRGSRWVTANCEQQPMATWTLYFRGG